MTPVKDLEVKKVKDYNKAYDVYSLEKNKGSHIVVLQDGTENKSDIWIYSDDTNIDTDKK